jgi:hypothetical protein
MSAPNHINGSHVLYVLTPRKLLYAGTLHDHHHSYYYEGIPAVLMLVGGSGSSDNSLMKSVESLQKHAGVKQGVALDATTDNCFEMAKMLDNAIKVACVVVVSPTLPPC